MASLEIIIDNLLSPIVLSFLLGIFAQLVKSELEFPEPVLKAISVYLLFSIGLKGGHELIHVEFAEISGALLITGIVVILIPVLSYVSLRRLGGFDVPNSAGIAAHYGSVSSVTFFAALAFADMEGTSVEGFLPALVAFMEWSIIIALMIARFNMSNGDKADRTTPMKIFLETLNGRGVILLSGGIMIGYLIGDDGFDEISPLYVDLFKGMLMLFLLEMGMTAARQLRDFADVGVFMVSYGIIAPIIHGFIGVALATLVGLSPGGAFVFGTIVASSSYIDAPAAVRASLPTANPSIYLTSSLGITFPFNLAFGIPLYYKMAFWLNGLIG